MFDELVESRPHRQRSTTQALVSIAVHTVIIAVSIQLTRAVAATVTKRTADAPLFVARAAVPRTAQPAATTAAAALPAAPVLRAITAPIVVPTTLPSITPAHGFDPLRAGAAGDRHGAPIGTPDDNAIDSGPPVTLREAEEPVSYLDGPEPRYPPALRQVGVEGSVRLRYIVGTDGKVEPGSVEVLMSTNRSFEAPAIEAIKGSRFRPARVKGQRVRQLVEQMVRFTIH
jgi:protein TonB